ncbi:hypothetical protein [Streptomyces lavendulocolor]|uniref:hypothetical protein n=1 Tax=Streptomyces lavendulocolor TaxID=67316 RepID=UPI003C2C688B
MTFRLRGMLLAVVIGAATALTGATALAVASSAAPQTRVADEGSGSGADVLPHAVEDFGYPGADRILAEKGLVLRKGDGGIMLTECTSESQIQVWTRQNDEGRYCFQVTGKTGYLALEVKGVHAVQTEQRAVRASLTASGTTTTVDVAKDEYKPVGEGVIKNPVPAVLVELRVTG